MRILDKILGRRLEPTGELGYFGLTGWWMLEQDEAYEPAIQLCKQAQAAGWAGNWSWYIQRMTRKLDERNPVKSISSSGIRWLYSRRTSRAFRPERKT